MRPPPLTMEQLLTEVEDLIEAFRWARGTREPAEKTYRALKQVAADLRSRTLPNAAVAEIELGRRVEAAERSALRSNTGLGYEAKHLIAIGMEVMTRWPTLRRAIERYAEDLAAERNVPSMTERPF